MFLSVFAFTRSSRATTEPPRTRLIRADEIPVGSRIWTEQQQREVLRVRDLFDGRLTFTLRSGAGPTTELNILPWAYLQVTES